MTTDLAQDIERVLDSAAADVGEALQLRRNAVANATLRRGIQPFLDEERTRSGAPDAAEAGRLAAAAFILGRDGDVGRYAARSDSHHVKHLWGLAEIYQDHGLIAAGVLRDALQREPRDERVRLLLAPVLALVGRPDEAREVLEPLAGQTDRAAVLYALGTIAEAEGDYEGARQQYEAAHAEDPEHVDSLFRLAYHYDLSGDDDAAISLYEQARKIRPTRANILVNLGVLYEDRGDFDKAANCYRQVLAQFPTHPRAKPFLRDAVSSLSMVVDEDMERNEDRRNQILRTPVSDFELSVRARNCLAKMNIRTLGDLIQRTESELLAYKNFGETSLQEIKDILDQKGLRLGMRRDEIRLHELHEPAELTLPDVPEADAWDTSIVELELSEQAQREVVLLGVATIGELAERSEAELRSEGIGEDTIAEVQTKLAEQGLSLRRE